MIKITEIKKFWNLCSDVWKHITLSEGGKSNTYVEIDRLHKEPIYSLIYCLCYTVLAHVLIIYGDVSSRLPKPVPSCFGSKIMYVVARVHGDSSRSCLNTVFFCLLILIYLFILHHVCTLLNIIPTFQLLYTLSVINACQWTVPRK